MTQEIQNCENYLNQFIKNVLINNKLDDIFEEINIIYYKINQSGNNREYKAAKWAKKLRKRIFEAIQTIEENQKQTKECIENISNGIKNGLFNGRQYKKRRKSIDMKLENKKNNMEEIIKGKNVAAKIARSHELWILASIVRYIPHIKSYEVEDEDEDSSDDPYESLINNINVLDNNYTINQINRKRKRRTYITKQIISLPDKDSINQNGWNRYKLNQRVLAMYPNTTSFYICTVMISNPPGSPYVIVQFDDDSDEFGISPDRKIPYHFVTAIPNELNLISYK